MDSSESTKIVFRRIQELEPELASKIVGYLLLRDNGEHDMIRLAFSPDNVIHSITNEAKIELGLLPINKPALHQNTPQATLHFPLTNSYWNPPQEYCLQLQSKMQLLNLDEQIEFPSGNRYNPRFGAPGDFPSKICHYFSKGFCKHGSSCRYLHGNPNEGFADDQIFSLGSVEKLEFELTELLKSRNGSPVSIALLPMLYYEKYGRTLQAEGYLTESQRHGKAGYSLTKLLARMRPRIHIIERAHGQHSVILAEDLPKYMEYTKNEQSDHGFVPIGARQIYLTFPAASVFTEQDVSNYFSGFGPVEDVRIPCQQKRMFGFVTFLYPETVRKILAKGNPHYICSARVLVKPYREKSQLAERKNAERRLVRKQFMEEHEQRLEIERRLSEMQLVPKPLAGGRHGQIDYSTTTAGYGEQTDFMSPQMFSFLFEGEENDRCTSDLESSNQGVSLPASPFANSIPSRMSTVT